MCSSITISDFVNIHYYIESIVISCGTGLRLHTGARFMEQHCQLPGAGGRRGSFTHSLDNCTAATFCSELLKPDRK